MSGSRRRHGKESGTFGKSKFIQELSDFMDDQPYILSFIEEMPNTHEYPMDTEASGSSTQTDELLPVPPLLVESSSDEMDDTLVKNFAYRLMRFNYAVNIFCKKVIGLSYDDPKFRKLNLEEQEEMVLYLKAMCLTLFMAALTEIRTFVTYENFFLRLASLHQRPDILELVFSHTNVTMMDLGTLIAQEAHRFADAEAENCCPFDDQSLLLGPRHALIYRENLVKTYEVLTDYQTMLKNTDANERQIATQNLIVKIDQFIARAETYLRRIDRFANHSLIPPPVEMNKESTQSILKSNSKESRQNQFVKIGSVEYCKEDEEGVTISETFSPEAFKRVRYVEKSFFNPNRAVLPREKEIVTKSPEVAVLTKDYSNEKTVMKD